MSKIPERFIWASEYINVQPGETILEIGCGAGILTELIAARLKSGHIKAVDKSKAMLEKARKRNSFYIDNGTVRLENVEFAQMGGESATYEKIVAFNVNFFWKDTEREFELIRRILKPGGLVCVFYQAPYDIDMYAAEPIKEKLVVKGFEIVNVELKRLSPTSAFCVLTRPKM